MCTKTDNIPRIHQKRPTDLFRCRHRYIRYKLRIYSELSVYSSFAVLFSQGRLTWVVVFSKFMCLFDIVYIAFLFVTFIRRAFIYASVKMSIYEKRLEMLVFNSHRVRQE